MNIEQKNRIFIRCCYGYAVSGMAVLVIGAILPSVITEAGISFLAAGGLLSVMALGNLMASFLFPLFVRILGRRRSVAMMASLTPVCLIGIILLPPLPVLYLIMFLYGIVRGSITILNNAAVNDLYEENAAGRLNLLHCSFAIGAFLAPFLTAVFMKLGLGWRSILYVLVALTVTSALSYATMDDTLLNAKAEEKGMSLKKNGRENRGFLKSVQFYYIAFILFFYLGVENCINGWFVTYLQNTGVMSEAYATTLVSVTWLVIMLGRLVCAALSKKMAKSSIILMNAVGSGVCFFLLIFTGNLALITMALIGFGFFLSGIYPTCIADAGPLIQGSTFGMSVITAISALGGIITPQLVGAAADYMGIVAAISILIINVILVILLAALNAGRQYRAG